MTTNIKIGIGVGAIIILAAGAWAMGLFGTTPTTPATLNATTTPQQQAAGAPSDLPTASNDASDQALAQDAAALDAQIGGLSSDSASVDQSMNDKPVTQEY